jgi:hypothetical protein
MNVAYIRGTQAGMAWHATLHSRSSASWWSASKPETASARSAPPPTSRCSASRNTRSDPNDVRFSRLQNTIFLSAMAAFLSHRPAQMRVTRRECGHRSFPLSNVPIVYLSCQSSPLRGRSGSAVGTAPSAAYVEALRGAPVDIVFGQRTPASMLSRHVSAPQATGALHWRNTVGGARRGNRTAAFPRG